MFLAYGESHGCLVGGVILFIALTHKQSDLICAGIVAQQAELGVEEHIEFIDLYAENPCEYVVTELVDDNEESQRNNEL